MAKTPDPKIVNELVSLGWSARTLEVGLHAKFRCEYCGRCLIDTVDDYFYFTEVDHIHPVAKEGPDVIENMAYSCKACNFIKRAWVPNADVKWDANQRRKRIAEAKCFIQAERQEKADRLKRVQALLGQLKSSDEMAIHSSQEVIEHEDQNL
ncbi:MAG: HNH endonuclease signature motif containing protein [Phycisphaeraceae bacterium]